MFTSLIKSFFYFAVFGIFFYAFSSYFGINFDNLYHRYFPCRKPIVYTVDSFDTHFGISKESFIKAAKEAEAIWEKPLSRELFTYDTDENTGNDLKLNLIYDFRQEATDTIKNLSADSSGTRASYDAIKLKYESAKTAYLKAKKNYEERVALFRENQRAYNEKVSYWNSRGGAPENIFNEMKAEEASFKKELSEIKDMERDLSEMVANVNDLVKKVNDLAKELNLNVSVLNNINEERGEEFTQGEFKSGRDGYEINVYEFNSHEKLVRLLAHEFGHALGIEHVPDPKAIMYYLNENRTGILTPDDLDAIKTRCGIM